MAYEINFCETKEQLKHLGEVVTGKTDGSPTGADIDTSTLAYTGQERGTLPSLLAKIGWYSAGEWSSDPLISNDNQYVVYNGDRYVPLSTPYQVNSTLNPNPELLVGTELKLITDIKYTDLTDAQEELLPPGSQIYPEIGALQNGQIVTSGTTHLRVSGYGWWGGPAILSMSPIASGAVSSLTETGAIIGGTAVSFTQSSKSEFFNGDEKSAVENMVEKFNINPLAATVSHLVSTGGTVWEYTDSTGPITESNFRAFNAVNIKDFDKLLGDGRDATVALTKAAALGLPVYAPSGEYGVSSEVDIQSGSGILSDQRAVFKQVDDSNLTNLLRLTSTSDVRFSNVTIDINAANQSAYVDGQQPNIGRGILATSCSKILLDNVEIDDLFGTAFYAIDCSEITINKPRLKDNVGRFSSYGLYFVRSQHVSVTDGRFYGTQNFGVGYTTFMVYARDTCVDVTVQGCYFEKSQCFFEGKTTGGLESYGTGWRLLGNTFEQPPADIACSYCKRGVIQGNIVRRSGDYGLSIGDSEFIIAVGNEVQESNTVAMSLRKSTHCILASNIIRDPCTNWRGFSLIENQRVGIYVIGDSLRNIITGNSITDFQVDNANKMFHAIRVEDFAAGVKGDDSSFALISLNICWGSKSGIDIYADGVNNVVTNDNIRNDGITLSVNVGSTPSPNPKEGDIRSNVVNKKLKYYDGENDYDLPRIVPVPASPTSPGKVGDIAFNASYFYWCNSEDTWQRVAKDGTWT